MTLRALAVLVLLVAAGEAMAGSLSGRITSNAGGGPIAEAQVSLCKSVGNCQSSVLTDADGKYRFDRLEARTYTIRAVKAPHVTRYYDGVVNVPAEGETTGVDVTMTLGGTISGTVRRASNGEPVHGLGIVMTSANPTVLTQTVHGGVFQTGGLPPGEYRVATQAGDTLQLVNQLYPGQHCVESKYCSSRDFSTAATVTVTPGSSVTGVDFLLVDWPRISGQVKRADGTPVTSEWVFFDDTRNNVHTSHSLVPNGVYTRALPPGNYRVSVQPGSNYFGAIYPNVSCTSGWSGCTGGTPVRLTTTPVTGIDITVQLSTARMQGTIRDRNGAPFAGIEVAAVLPNGRYADDGTTDASGRYVFPDLQPGRYYLKAVDELLPHVDCNYPCSVQGATPFDLTAGTTTTADMQVRSARSTFTGRATKAAGGAPVRVESMTWFADRDRPQGIFTFQSQSDGTYKLTVVSRGNMFYLRAYATGLLPTLHPNVPNPCPSRYAFCLDRAAIQVPAGTRSGIDFVMSPYGVVSGTITDKVTGAPFPNVPVTFRQMDEWAGQAMSDAQGRFRFPEAYGRYQVYVETSLNNLYSGQVYPGRDCTARCDPKTGSEVRVTAGGETAGIDFQLHGNVRYARITGTVRDAVTGKPIGGAPVRFAQNGTDVASVTTNASGVYLWTLANGMYHVYVPQWGANAHLGQVYPGRDCDGACDSRTGTLVHALDGSEKTGIDFQLRAAARSQSGRISGQVIDDQTGDGVANARVRAWSSTFSAEDVTDARGFYTIEKNDEQEALPPGDYRLSAELAPYFVSVYGGPHCPAANSCDQDTGALVRATALATTAGIDFRLIRTHAEVVTPAAGPVAGGTWITISGRHFAARTKVWIGAAGAEVVSVTPTAIVAITPPGPAGAAHVTVGMSRTSGTTIPNGFVYLPGSSRRRSARH